MVDGKECEGSSMAVATPDQSLFVVSHCCLLDSPVPTAANK